MAKIEADGGLYLVDDDSILVFKLDNSQSHFFFARQKKGRPLVAGQSVSE
jgi:hypothetical protein